MSREGSQGGSPLNSSLGVPGAAFCSLPEDEELDPLGGRPASEVSGRFFALHAPRSGVSNSTKKEITNRKKRTRLNTTAQKDLGSRGSRDDSFGPTWDQSREIGSFCDNASHVVGVVLSSCDVRRVRFKSFYRLVLLKAMREKGRKSLSSALLEGTRSDIVLPEHGRGPDFLRVPGGFVERLANPANAPLHELARILPHNFVKFGPLLDMLADHRVPFQRATWYLKILLVKRIKPGTVDEVRGGSVDRANSVARKIRSMDWLRIVQSHMVGNLRSNFSRWRYCHCLVLWQIQEGLIDWNGYSAFLRSLRDRIDDASVRDHLLDALAELERVQKHPIVSLKRVSPMRDAAFFLFAPVASFDFFVQRWRLGGEWNGLCVFLRSMPVEAAIRSLLDWFFAQSCEDETLLVSCVASLFAELCRVHGRSCAPSLIRQLTSGDRPAAVAWLWIEIFRCEIIGVEGVLRDLVVSGAVDNRRSLVINCLLQIPLPHVSDACHVCAKEVPTFPYSSREIERSIVRQQANERRAILHNADVCSMFDRMEADLHRDAARIAYSFTKLLDVAFEPLFLEVDSSDRCFEEVDSLASLCRIADEARDLVSILVSEWVIATITPLFCEEKKRKRLRTPVEVILGVSVLFLRRLGDFRGGATMCIEVIARGGWVANCAARLLVSEFLWLVARVPPLLCVSMHFLARQASKSDSCSRAYEELGRFPLGREWLALHKDGGRKQKIAEAHSVEDAQVCEVEHGWAEVFAKLRSSRFASVVGLPQLVARGDAKVVSVCGSLLRSLSSCQNVEGLAVILRVLFPSHIVNSCVEGILPSAEDLSVWKALVETQILSDDFLLSISRCCLDFSPRSKCKTLLAVVANVLGKKRSFMSEGTRMDFTFLLSTASPPEFAEGILRSISVDAGEVVRCAVDKNLVPGSAEAAGGYGSSAARLPLEELKSLWSSPICERFPMDECYALSCKVGIALNTVFGGSVDVLQFSPHIAMFSTPNCVRCAVSSLNEWRDVCEFCAIQLQRVLQMVTQLEISSFVMVVRIVRALSPLLIGCSVWYMSQDVVNSDEALVLDAMRLARVCCDVVVHPATMSSVRVWNIVAVSLVGLLFQWETIEEGSSVSSECSELRGSIKRTLGSAVLPRAFDERLSQLCSPLRHERIDLVESPALWLASLGLLDPWTIIEEVTCVSAGAFGSRRQRGTTPTRSSLIAQK